MLTRPSQKYRAFAPIDLPDRQWPSRTLTQAPRWCSVDLRDGNQALVEPMNIHEKLELFELLVQIGFKEIEIGFPSASQIEFDFVRTLIERNLIPSDVKVQVLTQAREHLIRRSFEALEGAENIILHLYNSTSATQRRVVFRMSQDEVLGLAVEGTKLVRSLANDLKGSNVQFEYSPESFTGTELDFALRICEAVSDTWGATHDAPIILNLPSTVELATPNVYADQIEWFCRQLSDRDRAVISVHTHNDRGTAVAAAELSQMAGAQRVEGTLFGYGERTGNVDIVTLALNLYSQGIHPGLDLSRLEHVAQIVTKCTDNPIHPRHPYAGELVFTAFSGSHQDAISKGMKEYADDPMRIWDVPYIPVDPHDIGRDYTTIIRVNSQSGKGGTAYVLKAEAGYDLPKGFQQEFSGVIQRLADATGKEVSAEEIVRAFTASYLEGGPIQLLSAQTEQGDEVSFIAQIDVSGEIQTVEGKGNGPIDAFVAALAAVFPCEVVTFSEHSLGLGSDAQAVAYANVRLDDRSGWGAGIDTNATTASFRAILSAIGRLL
ncbi:MAG: 2-isopropylmalate synthase [Fimbriimonas sp.]